MRVPNPTKLLPRPSQVFALTRRVAGLLPRLPGQGSRPETDSPPSPAPVTPPSSPAKLKPVTEPKSPKTKAKAAKPKAKGKPSKPKKARGQPRTAPPGTAVGGFPEPAGKDPGDISGDRDPHHALNNPVGDPDPTARPDPYDRDAPALDPHPDEDPDAQARHEKIERDKLDP